MKKYIFALVATLFLFGCEDTNENLVQERGMAVVPIMSEPAPALFQEDIDVSYVQFDLSLASGETVDKAEIEVVSGGKSAIVKAVTIPATGVIVTAREVLSALNIPDSDFKAGDVFNLFVLTTKNGKVTRSIASVGVPVVCYFEPSMLVGKFYYISGSWGEEGEVTLEADPDDPYKIYIDGMAETQGLTSAGNKLELNFNPNNFSLSGPRVVVSDDLSPWGLSYTAYAYTPVSGTYDSCEESYTVTYGITVSAGSYGNFMFKFTKME